MTVRNQMQCPQPVSGRASFPLAGSWEFLGKMMTHHSLWSGRSVDTEHAVQICGFDDPPRSVDFTVGSKVQLEIGLVNPDFSLFTVLHLAPPSK